MPAANYNGNFSVTWQATDATDWSTMDALTITVAPINDIPVVSDVNLSTDEDTTYTFALGDFTGNYTDIENSPLSAIKVTSLPNALYGTLKYNGTNASVNQVIDSANIGLLQFVPTLDYNGNAVFGRQ